MSELHKHSVVGPAFDAVVKRRWKMLVERARQRGVAPADSEDVVAKAVLRVSRLALQADIASLAANWHDTPENRERLDSHITALLGHYLRYEVADYRRAQKRLSRKQEEIATNAPSPSELQSFRNLLVELFAREGIRVDAYLGGDIEEAGKLFELLYDRARLSDIEWRYARWRRLNPESCDFEFDLTMHRSHIARIKKSAILKIRYYIHHGRPLP